MFPLTSASRVFVAGANGLVGSAIVRRLRAAGFSYLLTPPRTELDLEDGAEVQRFFDRERPEYVFLAAALVGGILANSRYPADFIRSNLAIQCNVIDAAYQSGTEGLMFLGSSCIYPKYAPQPLREEYLLTGELEPTNQPYAIAKIAGIEMCQAYNRQYGTRFVSVMPTNLYGPGDNFDLETSHVIPALLRKFHEARLSGAESVEVWGTGNVLREFLHVDDLADACVHVAGKYTGTEIINIGSGQDISIRDLATLIAKVVGFRGRIDFDASRPDGTPRKLLDVSRLTALGWEPKIALEAGLRSTYEWFAGSAPIAAVGSPPRHLFAMPQG